MGIPLTLSSVPAQTPYVQYVATNGQTVFPYPFEITQDSDLVVVVNGVTLATDNGYSLSGQGNSTGGNLTFTLGQSAGTIVTLYRDIPIQRISQIAQNSGFSSTAFNAEYNNIYLILQQLAESASPLGFSLQVPNSNNPTPTTMLLPSAYANMYLAFNSSGNPVPAVLSSTTMTAALIGALVTPQTTAEANAGVTPTYAWYQPGDLRRYGATYNGNNTTALLSACQQANQATLGAPIYIPGSLGTNGTITSGAAFTFTTPVKIYGDGPNLSVLGPTSDFTLFTFALGASASILQGISIIGIGNSGTLGLIQPAVAFNDCNNTLIDDSWITRCGIGVQYQPGTGGNQSSFINSIRNSRITSNNIYNIDCQKNSNQLWCFGVTIGGGVAGAPITNISQAASAVVTFNYVSAANPFANGQNLNITGVTGMTQINALTGNVTATGGSSGAWTVTLNINSSAFTAYVSGGGLKPATTGLHCLDSGGPQVFGFDAEGLTYCVFDIDSPTSTGNGCFNICGGDIEGNSCTAGEIRIGASNTNPVIGGKISGITLSTTNSASFLNYVNGIGLVVENIFENSGYGAPIDGWLNLGANGLQLRVDNYWTTGATIGASSQYYGNIVLGHQPQSGAATALASSSTITTKGCNVQRIAPTGAVTGIILQAGYRPGQTITVINESTGADSATMAAAGISNVANGTSCAIAGLTCKQFYWDTVAALWYSVGG